MTIGERLKILRQNLDMTAKDLSYNLDIPLRTIGGYERNENPPNEKFLTQLAEKYNVNINWLLTGKGKIFLCENNNLVDIIQKKYNISFENAQKIVSLIDNNSSRELVIKFAQAKNGDIEAIDALMQNLAGIKVVFT